MPSDNYQCSIEKDKDSFKKCRLAFICEFTTFISISLKNPFEFVYTLKEPSGECISVSTV